MKTGQMAALSSTLLYRKGGASTAGFTPIHHWVQDGGTVAVLAIRPRQPNASQPTRISLRLDPRRHQHLKLAAMKLGTSSRDLLLMALDHYLATVVPQQIAGPCCCLKETSASSISAAASSGGTVCETPGCLASNEPA